MTEQKKGRKPYLLKVVCKTPFPEDSEIWFNGRNMSSEINHFSLRLDVDEFVNYSFGLKSSPWCFWCRWKQLIRKVFKK